MFNINNLENVERYKGLSEMLRKLENNLDTIINDDSSIAEITQTDQYAQIWSEVSTIVKRMKSDLKKNSSLNSEADYEIVENIHRNLLNLRENIAESNKNISKSKRKKLLLDAKKNIMNAKKEIEKIE